MLLRYSCSRLQTCDLMKIWREYLATWPNLRQLDRVKGLLYVHLVWLCSVFAEVLMNKSFLNSLLQMRIPFLSLVSFSFYTYCRPYLSLISIYWPLKLYLWWNREIALASQVLLLEVAFSINSFTIAFKELADIRGKLMTVVSLEILAAQFIRFRWFITSYYNINLVWVSLPLIRQHTLLMTLKFS